MIKRLFIEHPSTVGESYVEHLRAAGGFAVTLVAAGIACFVHALVPCLFVKTGSRAIERLHERMIIKRSLVRQHRQ